jgi:sugar O-acyltransferase (sialic acid O-acetyltransferase NeuD family)
MKDIVIIGAGGFADEVLFLIEDINKKSSSWNFKGFVNQTSEPPHRSDKLLFGTEEDLIKHPSPIHVVIGIGTPKIIEKIFNKLSSCTHITFPNLLHPSFIYHSSLNLGSGNIICANNIFTTNIIVGNCNIFNLNCTYGHDINIGSFNVFNPGINGSGGVVIGNKNLVGTGSTLLQYTALKNNNILGAGAVLTKSYASDQTLVGIPAKPLKT